MTTSTPENISKVENLNELLSAVNAFCQERQEEDDENATLLDFLSEISLATDEDRNSDDGRCVRLMTVHASKGLEFKNVIIVGVEEELFPATMSADTIYGIEEERRLLYVAITRAETTCVISYAKHRFKNGSTKDCVPSRFIRDIDQKLLRKSHDFRIDSYESRNLWQRDDFSRGFGAGTGSFESRVKPSPKEPANIPHLSERFSQRNKIVEDVKQQQAEHYASFGLHAASELTVGSIIDHFRFGRGVITKVDTSGSDAKIVVDFDEVGTKTLLLKFAKFNIL